MWPILYFGLLMQTSQNIKAADAAFHAGYAAMAEKDLARAHIEFAKVVELVPQLAAGHSAFGAVLLAEGDDAAAIQELEQAHKLDSSDETATLNLATAYSEDRRYPESVALFRALDAGGGSAPTNLEPKESLAYATALAATGDAEDAVGQLRRAAAAAPDNAELADALGTVLAQQQKYDEAQSNFERALALDSRSVPAHTHLGSLYLIQQKVPQAITELAAAAALAPNDLQANLQLGRAQMSASEDEAAIATLRHAHELAPAAADVDYELALALQNAGKSKDALPLFAAVVAAKPEDGPALTNYALALVQTGQAKQAIPLYEHALTLSGQTPVLHEDLGVAYLQQSDLDHAIQQFEAGLALPGDGGALSAELHYDLGLALKLKDRLPEAIPQLVAAEKIDPSLPDPPYTLGVLYMQTGKFEDAARELEKATTMRPGNGDAWSILGSVYREMDQPVKAIVALRRAIALLPDQPSPHITLAAILAQQGDKDGAAAERKTGAALSRVAVSRQRANFALDSGNALIKKGQMAEGVAQLQAAVAADPTYDAAHRALADALEQQGNTAEAALERAKAEALDKQGP